MQLILEICLYHLFLLDIKWGIHSYGVVAAQYGEPGTL